MSVNEPILKQILQAVQDLASDVHILKDDVGTLKNDVQMLKEDVSTLKDDVQVLKEDVSLLKGDVNTLKSDVNLLKEDVNILKEDVRLLKDDANTLKGDVNTLKVDVNLLKIGQDELYQLTTAIRSAQELSHAKLEGLTLDVRHLEGSSSKMETKLDEETLDVRGEIRFLNHRRADLELDVDKLKNTVFSA